MFINVHAETQLPTPLLHQHLLSALLPHLLLSAFIANIITLRTRYLYSPLDHFNIVDLFDPPIARASLRRNPIDSTFSGYATSITNLHTQDPLN